MVSKDIVMGTIRRMHEAGIENETIKSTLRDIGLSDEEISANMAESGLETPSAPKSARQQQEKDELSLEEEPSEEANAEDGAETEEGAEEEPLEETDDLSLDEGSEEIAEKTAQKLRPHLDSMRAEQGMRDNTYKVDMYGHKERLDDLGQQLEEVSASMPRSEHISELTLRVKALEEMLGTMQRDISDIKASSNALQSLLTKILDTNRQILLQAPKKK